MRWGRWGTWPRRWGGSKPLAQRLYEGMRDNRGERYSKDDNDNENKSLRCAALVLARAARYQEAGANQAFPSLATYCLPGWERRLGVVPDARDTEAGRRALLDAILAGNGPPDYEHIIAACSKALGGEPVDVVAATSVRRTPGTNVLQEYFASVVASGGRFRAGIHYVSAAYEIPSTTGGLTAFRFVERPLGNLALSLAAGNGIRVGPIPLAAAAGATRVHYFLSVAENATSMALACTGDGSAIELFDYPRNLGTPGLHNLAIVVSEAAWADPVKRSKLHAVLGPWLPTWVDYEIVASSPFKLDVSPLDKGAF